MTKEQLNNFYQDIEKISENFEQKPFTENVKLLKENFKIDSLNTPNHYQSMIDELSEIIRESRVLFIYSVLNKVCEEDEKVYLFDVPYQASMNYIGVMKKEGSFYLQDEDKDFREIFSSEGFTHFIDTQYWKLYE